MTGWNPDGEVLLVGQAIDSATLADVMGRLAPTTVHRLDLVDAEDGEACRRMIRQALRSAPGISTILALGRDAARHAWPIARRREGVLVINEVDAVIRLRESGMRPDLTDSGLRRASFAHAFEFSGMPMPAWSPGCVARVIVGPRNAHGTAYDWARAARLIPGVDALSLGIGDAAFPAELMLTSADWDDVAVRQQLLDIVADATHLLVDDDSPLARSLIDQSANARLVGAQGLPPAVSARPRSLGEGRHIVVVGGTSAGDPPEGWRVTDLREVPLTLHAATILTADIVCSDAFTSLEARPLAEGAVLVSHEHADVPHAPELAEVIDPHRRRALSELTRDHIERCCAPGVVAQAIAERLGITT